MSEQKKTDKVVVTVLLTSGREMRHEYDAPIDSEEEGVFERRFG